MRKIWQTIRPKSIEDGVICALGASFFLGLWYSLPMLNVITDVWSYVGGALRAMQAHSVLPGDGVEYGTLTFYLNYLGIGLFLVIALLFNGFQLHAVETMLVFHPEYVYWISRAITATAAGALLWFLYGFLKEEVASVWYRLAIIFVTFGNVLVIEMFHSGKMWFLSIALCMLSFLYTYKAVAQEAHAYKKPGAYARNAIIFASLATANFPLAGLFLINVPIFLFAFARSKENLVQLVKFALTGAAIVIAVFLTNAKNIVHQITDIFVNYHPIVGTGSHSTLQLSFIQSVSLHLYQTLDVAALSLLFVAIGYIYGVRNKALALLVVLYATVYFVIVAFIANWYIDLSLYVRYSFPIILFCLFLLVALKPPHRYINIAFGFVGLGLFVYTTVLFMVPSTYNQALDYVNDHYANSQVVIEDHVFELDLPMNKKSFAMTATSSCGSRCQGTLAASTDIAFKPVVITWQSDPVLSRAYSPQIIVTEKALAYCGAPLALFSGGEGDYAFVDDGHNMGRLLFAPFYHLSALGKNIYIYQRSSCTHAVPFENLGEGQL